MSHPNPKLAALRPLLVGGLVFALVGLLMDIRGTLSQRAVLHPTEPCQGKINEQVTVSKEQLANLLIVPERDSKVRVRSILKEPYCQLPGLTVRAGVAAERDVYPLAFEAHTQLVILYEGNEYAGYRFSFE